MKHSRVSIVRCPDYSKAYEAVSKSTMLIGGMDTLIKPHDRVLLKVNLLSAKTQDHAVTTHPAIVEALVRLVAEARGIPIIGDASGAGNPGATREAFCKSGMKDVADKWVVEFANFETSGYEKVKVPGGAQFKEIYIARPVLESDVVISVPKIKTHSLALFTGAVKNMFGAVPMKIRKSAHLLAGRDLFGEALVDIYSVARPHMAVMDAVVGMEGSGPSQGTPKYLGLVMASTDCVALDIIASGIIGFDPMEIPTNAAAIRRGFCSDIDEIETVGESPDMLVTRFKRPASFLMNMPPIAVRIISGLHKVRPYIKEEKCIRCNTCVNHCPAGAIGKEYPLRIQDDRCIQCFCCHELCPQGAVALRKSLIARLL